MTELERLESEHAALCEEINEGSEQPVFNRGLAIKQRDKVWARICELRGNEQDDDTGE